MAKKIAFSARSLCGAGLLIMPSLLFNPSTIGRIAQFLLFWLFAALLGKKTNVLMTVLVLFCVIFFNILIPYGRIMWSFGVFTLTEGALWGGIRRAVTLEGLIMLSKACVRDDLRFPGFFGAVLGESFRMFAALTAYKRRISPKTFIADIDAALFEISAQREKPHNRPPVRASALGWFFLAAAVIVSWLFFNLFGFKSPPLGECSMMTGI
jgi:heptaprenyl diphosphate synthase